MSKPLVLLLVLVVLSTAALWGLTPADSPADFTLAIGTEPGSLDPAVAGSLDEGRLSLALLEGLTAYNPADPSHPLPGVAERWQVSPDGLRYTFHLRAEARWSNGEPVTAEDFRASWLRLLDPRMAAPNAFLLDCIDGVAAYRAEAKAALKAGRPMPDAGGVGIVAVSPRVLEVLLTEPTPYFINLTAFWALAPVHTATVEAYPKRWFRPEHIVCNGPYVLQKWRFFQKLRLVSNPHYWDAAGVRSGVIDVVPVDSENTAFLMYESGTVDMITSVPRFLLDRLRDRPDFHTSTFLATYFCRFNCRRSPFNDVRVRRAFSLAVDRQRLVRTVTRGGERPARSFVPPGTARSRPYEGPGYDPEAAKRWLAEAGYPDGRGFPRAELVFRDREQVKATAELLQAGWLETLGVKVTLMNRPGASADVKSGEYNVAPGNWVADYNDPSTFLDIFTTDHSGNRTGWSNAAYDAAVRAAHRQPDPEERIRLWRQAERILVENEVPVLVMYFPTNTNMYRSTVQGISENMRNIHPLKYVYRSSP